MLMGKNSDDEKRVVISSTTNEWPQHMIPNDHNQKSLIINQSPNNNKNMASYKNMASSSSTVMDQKAGQEHPHQALKCPRCDSSNTKFCYYNNYSLSQPRHFCKACKRYWTRGGTLRNVPVGGGCRKNKRLRRSSSAAAANTNNNSSPGSSNLGPAGSRPSAESQHHSGIHSLLTSGQSSHIGSLLYNAAGASSLPFSRYDVSVQPHSLIGNALGLGFSNHNNNGDQNNSDALVLSSNPLLSNYGSILSSSSPTIASLLASKFSNGTIRAPSLSSNINNNNFQGLGPFEELNIGHEAGLVNNNKQMVKMEFEGQGRSSSSPSSALESWINGADHHNHHHHRTDPIGLSSDPSLYWASQTAVGGGASWHDPTANNIGVPSLI